MMGLVHLYRGADGHTDAAMDLAVAHALVRRASEGRVTEALRVYRPSTPVLVFGRADTRAPGFSRAAEAARAAGFQPVVRATGGRAVAYTTEALVVDHVRHEPDPAGQLEQRFLGFGELLAETFRGLGVDARVGAVPGEYCPGAQSVNARGVVKLVGTSQRVVKAAWLFSSLLVVGDAPLLRPVLTEVYAALGQPFDDASVGSLSDEVEGLTVARVEAAVLQAYAATGKLEPAELDEETLSLADELVVRHRP